LAGRGWGTVWCFTSQGWAVIQSFASSSEVNFPKWWMWPLGHVIRTRQIRPFCTGDKTVKASPIEPNYAFFGWTIVVPQALHAADLWLIRDDVRSAAHSQKAKPTGGAVLDLRRNFTQPFLSAICPSLMASDICLEIIYLIVCGSKLIRELLSGLF
jgi:hypothetical protein